MARSPSPWRSLLWRVGVGTPSLERVRRHVEEVAKNLEDAQVSAEAAWELGVSGLYRSPATWGGGSGDGRWSAWEWALRCQAASFEIAVALGNRARPFVEEHAFGPIQLLHGVAVRALLRIHARDGGPSGALQQAWKRVLELDEHARAVALDALRVSPPKPNALGSIVSGLDWLVQHLRGSRAKLLALEPLVRLAPTKARSHLPFLRDQFKTDQSLEAALLVHALEPDDLGARTVLRSLADHHPDPEVRASLEMRLKPPVFVGGTKEPS